MLFVVALLCATFVDAWSPQFAPGLRQAGLAPRRVLSPPRLQLANDKVDDLISTLRATTPEQLPKVLADNLSSIDQRLFLRLAEMSDAETDDYEKLRIRQLATLVTNTLETILSQADAQMDADAESVQEMLRTMALDDGEFTLPVPPQQLSRLRDALRTAGSKLDEGFVATVKAYMQKASDDGLDSMVDVLRVLLQTFAAEKLRALYSGGQVDASEGATSVINDALDAQPQDWDGVLKARLEADDAPCTADELVSVLQDKMGEIVLGMPAGSTVQSVIAEYLNELIGRARAIAAEQE